MQPNPKTFILIFLGILSAFGPFVMDMYLPTLPAMAEWFHTSSSAVQLSLTTSMIGLAAGQLIFGPLSDKYGRRPPLLVAMVLFALSTVGCIFSQTIGQFAALRLVQGIAGAGGVVISRSIAADKYSARELATMLALIGAINAVATVLAPIAGGVLAADLGWQGIFWCLFVLGLVLLAASIWFKESLPRERVQNVRWADMAGHFREVLRNRQYVCYILQYGFTLSVLFVNIASAPFIMQQHYGLSPLAFSLCFAVNAVGMAITTAYSGKFPTMEQALQFGSNGMLVLATLLCAALWLDCNFWTYEILLLGLLGMVGMSLTASNTLAMDSERHNAGIASALLGAVGFAAGGIVSPLAGFGHMLTTTGALFVLSAFCAYSCTQHALHARHILQYVIHKSTGILRGKF